MKKNSLNHLLFFFFFFLFLNTTSLLLVSSSSSSCHSQESSALLQFKQHFSINCKAEGCGSSPVTRTDSWIEGTDCCAWEGVICDDGTGHVVGLSVSAACLYGTIPSNSTLFDLVHLEQLNLSCNNFNSSQISPSFSRLRNLTLLLLYYSNLSGQIPSDFHLPNLSRLDLSSNTISGIPSDFHLPNLSVLDLSGNTISGIPSDFHLPNLSQLYLSGNTISGIPSDFHLPNLSYLILSGNTISGIPSDFHLPNLSVLDLSGNTISGIPSDFHLPNLSELHLSGNTISGIPSDFHLPNLSYLDLSGNTISGIPSDFHLPNLSFLDLSGNTISGIPSDFHLPNLSFLYLSSNELSGTIKPAMFGKKLRVLGLSSNKFSGAIELDIFAKLENLIELDLSNSGLSLTTANSVHSSNNTFQHIQLLRLASCNLSNFPYALLRNPNDLEVLDLNNNTINEQLHPLICDLSNLRYLDLSNNQFYGLLPTCLGNFSFFLQGIKLQRNNFHGTIPQIFASRLQVLDLSHNGFHGMVPRSLANCSGLEVLNMGHNSIADVFPLWLGGSQSILKVLVLPHNKFYGRIAPPPRNGSFFYYLHIIDVSHNDFIGNLPEKYFESWHSIMAANEVDSQQQYMQTGLYRGDSYSLTIMNKGNEMVLVKILINLVVVDFSSNNFRGKIPVTFGRLKGLHILNFSGNAFTGPIPLSFSNLTDLESLDLSKNKLSEEIPRQLTSLTFLEVFDVSQNNLTGLIPRGRQFETFSNASYEGNPGLCGFPLSKNCGNIKVPESPSDFTSSHEYSMFKVDGFCWEIVVIGYGCGMVIGLVIGSWIIRKREEWLERIFRVNIHSRAKRSKKIK